MKIKDLEHSKYFFKNITRLVKSEFQNQKYSNITKKAKFADPTKSNTLYFGESKSKRGFRDSTILPGINVNKRANSNLIKQSKDNGPKEGNLH